MLFADFRFRTVLIHLERDQLIHAVPQAHHALDAFPGGGVQIGTGHAAVFTVIYRIIYDGIGVVLDGGVCGDGCVDGLAVAQVGQLRLLIGAVDVLDGLLKLVGQIPSLNGHNGEVLSAILGAFRGLPAQHHFRVVDKVAVDGKTVCVPAQVYPIRLDVNGPVTLLQEKNVRHHIRSGIGTERIVGQTDGPQQLRPLGDVLADFRRLFIHGVTGGHESNHAARTHLIQRLCEEVIVNRKTELVVSPVIHLILSKRYVAHRKVKKVPAVRGFKARQGNVCLGIELLGDAAGDAVQLHAVQTAAPHFLRQHPEEIAHAHGRLQDVASFESHVAHRVVDGLDNSRAGVVSVQGGGSCRLIFLRGQQILQLRVFGAPFFLVRVKSVGKAAPAHIPGQDLLLFGYSLSAVRLQIFQQLDGIDVRLILGFRTADAQSIVRDMEVLSVAADLRLGFFIRRFLGRGHIGKGLPLTVNLDSHRRSTGFLTGSGIGSLPLRRVVFRLRDAQGANLNVVGKIVFVSGIDRNSLLSIGGNINGITLASDGRARRNGSLGLFFLGDPLHISGHLPDKRVLFQLLGVNYLTVNNSALLQGLPDGNRVNIIKAVLFFLCEKPIFLDKLGNTPLDLRPGHDHIRVRTGQGEMQGLTRIAAVFLGKPCGGFLFPPVLLHVPHHSSFAFGVAVPFPQGIVNILLGQVLHRWGLRRWRWL